jgi:transcriptional antiterminator RfaH
LWLKRFFEWGDAAVNDGTEMRWLVAQTQPNREQWAAENIMRQGYAYYLPRVAEQRRGVTLSKPLFPRYLFVQTPGQWRFLLGTFGVAAVIMHGEEAAMVPTIHMEALRAREGADGLIVLPEKPALVAGTSEVRVSRGHLKDHVGIYDGMSSSDRAKVLMDFLGRKTTVLVPIEDLENNG